MSCQPPNFPSPIHFFLYAWVHLLSMQMYAFMHVFMHSFIHSRTQSEARKLSSLHIAKVLQKAMEYLK